MIEARLRTVISPAELEAKKGQRLTDADYNIILSGPTTLFKPDGKLLLKYLPGRFSHDYLDTFYPVLHSLREFQTNNRGMAAGGKRQQKVEGSAWTFGEHVASAVVGAMDKDARYGACRLTAWTGKELDQWASLNPLFRDIGAAFAEHVPDRYAVQMENIGRTQADWVIEGTPFTTITVNNTWATTVHTDKGDLQEGFSNLTVLRRGGISGGVLVFPEYRVGVDMKDGDLLLMDAHEWHGNTALDLERPRCYICDVEATRVVSGVMAGYASARRWTMCLAHAKWAKEQANFTVESDEPVVDKERISIVSYYRTEMKECGTAEEEFAKARAWAEHLNESSAARTEELVGQGG